MTKTAQNPAGYGHGGLGYHHSLDAMPAAPRQQPTTPSWLPWAALLGASALGYAGVKGLGRLLRRAPRGPKPPAWSAETEMLGEVNPRWQRMAEEAEQAMAKRQARMLHDETVQPLMKASALLPALGRIARGT